MPKTLLYDIQYKVSRGSVYPLWIMLIHCYTIYWVKNIVYQCFGIIYWGYTLHRGSSYRLIYHIATFRHHLNRVNTAARHFIYPYISYHNVLASFHDVIHCKLVLHIKYMLIYRVAIYCCNSLLPASRYFT